MTGVEPFVGPVASGLTKIILDIAKVVGGDFFQFIKNRHQATEAVKNYAKRYQSRYGLLKLLGMPQAVPLASVYTTVRFLNELSIRRFESLVALEEAFRLSQERRFQLGSSSDKDGMTVAKENQYLLVLGGAGSGKTTFLRQIGLEAFKGEKGKLQYCSIPVLLELKHFTATEINLKKLITREFEKFGFPRSEEFITRALEQGKLLILLDGLDEVPKEHFSAVIEEIQTLVSRYDRNRFIASCRTAAYRSIFYRENLQNFRDIELSDFNNQQIQQFIHNWFQSEPEIAVKCWETLNQPGNLAAKELAQNPLLLTFLCLTYTRSLSLFPDNRSTLYNTALDILLREWAAEKRVQLSEIYQKLRIDLEKILLSEIAYRGFWEDQLFFQKQQLISHIREFLADTVDNPKNLDGEAVLETIAVQQGILVERAEKIFSFSHLTLQEYLTAQYIWNGHQIEQLVTEHLSEKRWQEVFGLVAGLMPRGDELLSLIQKTATHKHLNTPKLRSLLVWANQAISGSGEAFKPVAKRALALALALAHALAYALSHTHALAYANALVNALTLTESFANTDAFADVLANARAFANALAFAHTFAFTLSNTNISTDAARQYVNALSQTLDQADSLVLALKKVDFFEANCIVLENTLDQLKKQIPMLYESRTHWGFLRDMQQIWLDALQLDPELVDLSYEEVEELCNYLYANLLMIDCKKAAARVSLQAWKEIERQMLLV